MDGLKSGLGQSGSLYLDSIKNNSHYEGKTGRKWCPDGIFYARVVGDDGKNRFDKRVILGCKKWSCPVCAERNAYKLRKKAVNALKGYISGCDRKGFRLSYFVKFLTLTVPGREYRDFNAISDAEEQIKKSFDKLIRALRKTLGDFEYLWVDEPQKDGYPHLHVVLVGVNIAPRKVLWHIKQLWEMKYGMGKAYLKKTYGSVESLAGYITKYITKELRGGRKHSRVYSMSREMRSLFKVEDFVVAVVEFGRVKYGMDGELFFEPIWNKLETERFGLEYVPKWVYDDLVEDYQLKLPF